MSYFFALSESLCFILLPVLGIMLANISLRGILKSSAGVLRESCVAVCSAVSVKSGPSRTVSLPGPKVSQGNFAVPPPVRHYARAAKTKKIVLDSQLSDLPPTMLKIDYAAVPLAQTTDDLIKRLLSLELASHKEKLQLKTEQLIAKVQRDESDRNSPEVWIAILTARIRNYQEHLQKHHKDKANKRRMLMAIDRRKKLLKSLRLVRYDAFEKVCEQLGITYTFPPEYYRRATHRWLAKKELCKKVYRAVQKLKAEQRLKMKRALSSTATDGVKTTAAEMQ
ncbi:small ribosomal subunit protein uS15m isoform 2-T2 [Pholidichthys leucotaenia]